MPARRHAIARAVAVATVTVSAAVACGSGEANSRLAPPARPGQPSGTVVVTAGTDVAGTVRKLQDAITAGGGTVAATVDHTADAAAAGVTVPANTVVIGGAPATQLPLLRIDQRAGAGVPARYLVRPGPGGAATVTYDSAEYVTAVSGVGDPAVTATLGQRLTALAAAGTGGAVPSGAPLLGVTPTAYLLVVGGDSAFSTSLTRLRADADRGQSTVVAEVDLAAGSQTPGPGLRPTTEILVSTPAAEAPLIAAAPSFGLEMPMRYLVWVDANSQTQVGYPDVRRLAARHGLPTDDPNVARLAADADRLARLAALGTVAR